jgi:hypothetical protein
MTRLDYDKYAFGANVGWLVYLTKTKEYALVLAPDGDYSMCIISLLFDTEVDAKYELHHKADCWIPGDVPAEWKFEEGSWSERYARGD